MKSFIAASAVVAALAASSAKAATVNSPANLIECQPAAIQWNEAQGDVFLSVVKGKDISAAPLESFPTQNGASGSYTWTVNQPAGTQVTFVVNDSTGKPNYSSQVTVNPGSDSCLAAGAGGSSSASSGSSSSASGSSPSSSTKSGGSSSSTASSGSPSSTSGSSGSSGAMAFASVNGAAASVVGALAAGFAFFA